MESRTSCRVTGRVEPPLELKYYGQSSLAWVRYKFRERWDRRWGGEITKRRSVKFLPRLSCSEMDISSVGQFRYRRDFVNAKPADPLTSETILLVQERIID
jgi:hypothetical protein